MTNISKVDVDVFRILAWLTDRVEDGRGSIELSMTEEGNFGVFRNDGGDAWGTGNSVEEAIRVAIRKYPEGKDYEPLASAPRKEAEPPDDYHYDGEYQDVAAPAPVETPRCQKFIPADEMDFAQRKIDGPYSDWCADCGKNISEHAAVETVQPPTRDELDGSVAHVELSAKLRNDMPGVLTRYTADQIALYLLRARPDLREVAQPSLTEEKIREVAREQAEALYRSGHWPDKYAPGETEESIKAEIIERLHTILRRELGGGK